MSKIKTIRSLIDEVVDLITFTDDVVSTVRGKSYADTNRLAQLEPFCIYSRDLSNEDYLGEIQQLGLSIFVSYYLLAVETVADVDRAEVVKVLSAVNPDVGLESYSHSLVGLNELPIMSMEAKGSGGNRGGNRGGNGGYSKGNGNSKGKSSLKNVVIKSDDVAGIGKIKENKGISAIGKQVVISITKRGTDKRGKKHKTKEVNTFVKLVNVPIESKVLTSQLSMSRQDNSFSERWMKMRAGRIKFWTDFLFAEDLIREERRLLAHPDSAVFATIKSRHRAALLKAARAKGDSFGVGSNIVIISQDVLNDIERNSKHSITQGSMLKHMFTSLGFMLLMVVDREEEMVTLYFKNINQGSVHSISSIIRQNSSDRDGPDIISMIRDLSKSDVPNF